jgi:anti-anti-sigma factor
MNSTITKDGGTLLVRLEGDLTGGAEAMAFAKHLKQEIGAATAIESVVLDMKEVGFVDSSGLGMLLGAREASLEKGATLRLDNPNKQFRHLLEITRLAEILGVHS